MILNGRHIGLALVAAILKIERGSDQILIKHTLKNTYANFHAFMKFCTPKFVRSLAKSPLHTFLYEKLDSGVSNQVS